MSSSDDGTIKIDVEVDELESAITEMNFLTGQVEGMTGTLLDLIGLKPTAIFTVIASILSLIQKIQQDQREYEAFIKKEKGLQTRQQYRAWQAQDRLAIRASYRGDTN